MASILDDGPVREYLTTVGSAMLASRDHYVLAKLLGLFIEAAGFKTVAEALVDATFSGIPPSMNTSSPEG